MKKSIKYTIALCALVPIMAMGADTWWNGATVGNWEDAGNWGAGVPTASLRALLDNAADVATVNTAGAVTQNINMNNGASLIIASGGVLTAGEGHIGAGAGGNTMLVKL